MVLGVIRSPNLGPKFFESLEAPTEAKYARYWLVGLRHFRAEELLKT